MNERLKELVKEAGLTLVPNSKPIIYQGPMSELEKFAELIVRECAELATKEYNNCSSIHGNDLLEHFGVEE